MSKGPRSRVLLLGNPNSGKTTLFNALTGANAKVGNYPGITVEQRSGRLTLPTSGTVDLIDLPGTYSLSARSPEERIATHELIHGSEPSVAVVVVDATVLGRGLYLATQVAEIDTPLVVVVNMIDEAERSGLAIDTAVLSDRLGAEVVTTVASTRRGLVELRLAMDRALAGEERSGIRVPVEGFAEEAVAELGGVLRTAVPTLGPSTRRALSKWALLSTEPDDALGLVTQEAVDRLRSTAEGQGVDLDRDIIEARYRFVDETVALVSPGREGGDDDAPSLSTRLDDVLTHRIWGTVVFLGIVFVIFEALFSWSEPAMGWIEEAISMAQGWTASMLPPGPVQDLVVHGILAGAGNVIVFVPQIAILFLLIGILEDSGYLARAAFVLDRVMGLAGLHGKAFVPLLSGYACAIPAVMATRTIENERDRLITMLVVPLTSCSARLPVYVLLTATVFAPSATVWGLRLGAVVLFMMYALSLVAALLVASVLRRTILRGPRPSLVLELPPYRWPGLQTLLLGTWRRVRAFLVDAGTIILAITIVLWVLLSYPKDEAVEARFEERRAFAARVLEGEALEERWRSLEAEHEATILAHSWGGQVGRAIEPVLAPLGMDWRLGVGILGAFAAREVFVSTLGMVFGVGEVDEESASLRGALATAKRRDGSPLMTPLTGVTLMVFFVFACQCMSTVAVVRRESGAWKWALFLVAYMTVLAYGASLLVYQVGSLLGWGTG